MVEKVLGLAEVLYRTIQAVQGNAEQCGVIHERVQRLAPKIKAMSKADAEKVRAAPFHAGRVSSSNGMRSCVLHACAERGVVRLHTGPGILAMPWSPAPALPRGETHGFCS